MKGHGYSRSNSRGEIYPQYAAYIWILERRYRKAQANMLAMPAGQVTAQVGTPKTYPGPVQVHMRGLPSCQRR
jgi:hypothetical protein